MLSNAKRAILFGIGVHERHDPLPKLLGLRLCNRFLPKFERGGPFRAMEFAAYGRGRDEDHRSAYGSAISMIYDGFHFRQLRLGVCDRSAEPSPLKYDAFCYALIFVFPLLLCWFGKYGELRKLELGGR